MEYDSRFVVLTNSIEGNFYSLESVRMHVAVFVSMIVCVRCINALTESLLHVFIPFLGYRIHFNRKQMIYIY